MLRTRNIDTTSKGFLEELLKNKGLTLEVTDTNLLVRGTDNRLILSAERHGSIEEDCRNLTTKIFRDGNKSKEGQRLLPAG